MVTTMQKIDETLTKVTVNKLYGRFNYVIDIQPPGGTSKGMTIITAPNGYGKSTLLRLIHSFVNQKYSQLLHEKFAELTFHSSNGTAIRIVHGAEASDDHESGSFLDFQLVDIKSGELLELPWKFERNSLLKDLDEEETESLFYSADRELPYVRRISAREWRDMRDGSMLSRDEILEMILSDDRDPKSRSRLVGPDWLRSFRTAMRVLFISANRLRAEMEYTRARTRRSTEMVVIIAERIGEYIRRATKQYGTGSEHLQRTFPIRAIRAIRDHHSVSYEDIVSLIDEIRTKEVTYQQLGLLSEGQMNEIDGLVEDEAALSVLKTFLDDINAKMQYLYDAGRKLQLFVETINSMLLFKSLKPTDDGGFTILGDDDAPIELTALSSGEQHLIVLLGELIFGAGEGTIVLLDEPEISFHPEWQEKFPKVLEQVVEINRCLIVLATHSPDLIKDNIDSVIELYDQVQ
jgi:predicted ATP-binding protein involved in virulence